MGELFAFLHFATFWTFIFTTFWITFLFSHFFFNFSLFLHNLTAGCQNRHQKHTRSIAKFICILKTRQNTTSSPNTDTDLTGIAHAHTFSEQVKHGQVHAFSQVILFILGVKNMQRCVVSPRVPRSSRLGN